MNSMAVVFDFLFREIELQLFYYWKFVYNKPIAEEYNEKNDIV